MGRTSTHSRAVPGFELERFRYAEAAALMRELRVAEPVAVALVRRGYRTVAQARAFLEAAEQHEPQRFRGIDAALETIRAAIGRRERITVFGDYDVDGVTATAILVRALRELGADCDWFIPDRSEGYGLSGESVEALHRRGTRLIVTVDCGITAVAEVDQARAVGMSVVITDHHHPGDALPACPIVHPVVCEYPCPDLCAAGVAYKLACALLGPDAVERELDLVALATVADMVPLVGENRTLTRRGLALARRAQRPGLAALMRAASVAPERLDEGDVAFRLAPRINAAGRLYRADAGVELMLTSDAHRAAAIAAELDRANAERREHDRCVLAEAERRLHELTPELADAPAIVLWSDEWHPGVVGPCASRLVERHGKPTILIALEPGGRTGRGSARSIPGFDMLAGLRECGGELVRFGGHVAAAGLEIERARLDAFRDAFLAHARAVIDPAALAAPERIDAIVGGENLGYEVAEQLRSLKPFGKGNPEIRLLVPGAQVQDVRPLGEGERHARFSLASGAARAAGVAFGVNGSLAAAAEADALDVSVALELNEWNGAVSPRVVLGRVHERAGTDDQAAALPGGEPPGSQELAARIDDELARPPHGMAAAAPAHCRERIERGRASGVALVAALASSGEPVLVVAADALWRRALVERLVRPARFGGGDVALLGGRCSLRAGLDAAERVLQAGGVTLADWPALALAPGVAARFAHVVVVDPAPAPGLAALAECAADDDGGFLHVLADASDPSLALRALDLAFPDRHTLAALFRALRSERTHGAAGTLRRASLLADHDGARRAPELVARCLRVLGELGVMQSGGKGPERTLEVVSSTVGELERCPSFIAYRRARQECARFLSPDAKSS